MSKLDLWFRQIHLDFHTSECIDGIGAQFDPEEFAATLEKARVNSITCFARCHHGWIYYDTPLNPERRHPHLAINLLKAQIDACHARNIRVPIYTSVQWDHYTASQHPEWLALNEKGCISSFQGTSPFEAGFYRDLCLNSPYVEDLLKPHVKEIVETLPVDGLFFDPVRPLPCACRFCRAKMETAGLDFSDARARQQFALQTLHRFKQDMTRFVRQFNSECSIFYNEGHIGTLHRSVADTYTHFELESLPSGDWGYLHFPLTMRYARTLGKDCLGQTGKFHISWGDFHSYKNVEALQYECFRMLALGAKCSVGDQLHPAGKLDPHVYELIGSVYREVEKKEPWCQNAKPMSEIGVLTPEEFYGAEIGGLPPALMGITRMLQASAHQFDILDSASDLSRYQIIVLPDKIPVDTPLAQKLRAYLDRGGALIASFESGMNAEASEFARQVLGVRLKSDGPRNLNGDLVRGKFFPRADYAEYILPGQLGKGLAQTEYALYIRGMDVEAEPEASVLANKVSSYFDRTYQHFCSHRQTPSSGQVGGPAVVKHGQAIYFANPIFSEYNTVAPRWEKQLFLNALNLLLPHPLVRHDGPTTLQVTVNEQPDENRWIIHLLHYIPERRGQEMDIIEDVIPLHDVCISIKSPTIKAVMRVPEQAPLPYEQKDGRVAFVLPKLVGHQMIALELS
ncbi:MAG: beta-galactosidase trimerization domain-containing protein [Chloroflexi bacterium]|nr:beta-galactosidase trimerization domain-containing protein [Chloroflexota bacterium]